MATTPVPRLEETVDALVRLTHDIHGLTPRDLGRLYLACLALLYHLDVDNESIQRVRERYGDDAGLPSLDDLPAVAAVWRDRRLFRALLRCLRSGSDPTDGATETAPAVGRKRALSIGGDDGPGPSKAPKTSLSPLPASVRARTTGVAGLPEAAPGPPPQHQQHGPRPAPDVSVAAATALYAALWPFPHWPAPLVTAFADDCFGPLRWVDVDACGCRLLARNVSLSLQTETVDGSSEEGFVVADADRLAMTYHDFWDDDRDDDDDTDAKVTLLSGPDQNQSESDGSSSGEEDDALYGGHVDLIQSKDRDPIMCQEKRGTGEADSMAYPLVSEMRIQQSAVCPRFFGSNGSLARELLVKSLSSRLNAKSKQNSGLLAVLPSFTTVPVVRELVAEYLEKWLQSPALAGLARSLFYAVVKNMKNVDPPLRADLAVVDSIMKMHVKANQLNMHIENTVELAKSMSHAEVVDRIYLNCFLGIIAPANQDDYSGSDKLKMLVSVHNAIHPEMSYKCLAGILLHVLDQGPTKFPFETTADNAVSCANLVGRMLAAVKSLSIEIGHSFDGCVLLNALLLSDVNHHAWSAARGENKARLMLQCLVMHIRCHGSQMSSMDFSGREWQESLLGAKRKLLSWYCTDFLPRFTDDRQFSQEFIDCTNINGHLIPIPDYHGISCRHDNEQTPPWLNIMRCLLMIEDAGSEPIKQFLAPVPNMSFGQDELEFEAMRICREISRPVDDDMIWIVLRSCASVESFPTVMAIQIIENLIESCCQGFIHCLHVSDPTLIWELYNMVQYKSSGSKAHASSDGDVPLLALSGLWWRVTALAIIMCAASTDSIGKLLWHESPTICSAIKMITSNKYCFPTVDCDNFTRSEEILSDKRARSLERDIVEQFFLPPIEQMKQDEEERQGSRTSMRLREKNIKARSALERSGNRQRKKLLRAVQRAIMVWDPVAPARKPPREAIDLFVCTEQMFELADVFRHSTQPDFLLLTLGGTKRGAIERAHDWLIPVISKVPTTISRLPSNASSFLLLKSYGTNSGVELKTLSSPLLSHVKSCLLGQLGENEAKKALQLLLLDFSSPESEKRNCARRVLRACLTTKDPVKEENENPTESFLVRILCLDHAALVVKDCIRFMASAARLERGQNLVVLMLALDKFVQFASDMSIDYESPIQLPNLLLDIITKRAGVFSEAIDLFPSFRSWILNIIINEFTRQLEHGNSLSCPEMKPEVRMKLCQTSVERCFTLRLLEGLSVVLSMWKDEYSDAFDGDREKIEMLVDSLFESDDYNCNNRNPSGLTSAVLLSITGSNEILSLWLMLTRARSDNIAMRAALSAPAMLLPRLLLSSGLPKASLLTMSGRLSHLAATNLDLQSKQCDILNALVPNESAIGHLGTSTWKLQHRLAAYFRLNEVATDSKFYDLLSTPICWLNRSHGSTQLIRAKPPKTAKAQPTKGALASIYSVSAILAKIATADVPDASDDYHFHPQLLSFSSGTTRSVKAFLGGASDPSRAPADVVASFSDPIALIPFSINGTRRSEVVSFREIPFSPPPSSSLDIWEMLFTAAQAEDKTRFLDVLTKKCAMCWAEQQKRSCVKWILEHSTQHDIYSLDRMMLFVLYSFSWSDFATHPTIFLPSRHVQPEQDNWYSKSIADLALGNAFLCRYFKATAPWCLEMTVLAAVSEGQAKYAVEALQKRLIFVKENDLDVFRDANLYFHLLFPSCIQLKSLSMQIADAIPQTDVQVFSSAVDDRLINVLCFLKCNCDTVHYGRELTEIARVYPLHFIRKMRTLVDLLNADAMVTHPCQKAYKIAKDGRPDGKKEVLFEGRAQHVRIHYWGCTYSEGLWLSLADAVMSMPSDLLFPLGISVGLLDLLCNYLQLLLIHVQIQSALDETSRLKTKVADLLHIFEMTSPTHWQQWLTVVVEGSEIRKTLKSLAIIS